MYTELELEASSNYLVYNCSSIADSVPVFDSVARFDYQFENKKSCSTFV